MKILRTDRGGDKEMNVFLKSKGIVHQLTAPYTPEQNGVAERKNRSLIEMARCMLFDANMNFKYWSEAVNAANYLQNRLPSSSVEFTPYQELFNRKTNLNYVRKFGSTAYVHINKQKRRKLNAVSEKYILVGYCDNSKAYRLLNPDNNKIIISRDVNFIEDDKICKEQLSMSKSDMISFNLLQNSNELNDKSVVVDNDPEVNQTLNTDEDIHTDDANYDLMTSDDDEFTGFETISNDSSSSEGEVRHQRKCLNSEENVERRISSRSTKGIPPKRYALTKKR